MGRQYRLAMEFRRIGGLPPYVFAQIKQLVEDGRSSGRDIVDFGFGNPDLPSPPVAVEKLAQASRVAKKHR
jgi:alanine-synthesizing transaminase